jgi:peptidoglycan/LPS O-acetylase OafA/YrhL
VNNYLKKYFGNLDAIRFLAFVLVFFEHMVLTSKSEIKNSSVYTFYQTHFNLASVGVGYFIVLSGFLITWIILEEYRHTSAFNLPYFWLRRCLRIWPLYFLMIVLGNILIVVARHFYNNPVHDMPPIAYLLTFTSNFYMSNHGTEFLFFIAFLWSIGMEEQFYTLWGIVLKFGKRFFTAICILFILISLVFRVIYIHDNSNLYFNSLNWIGNFAMGSLLANFAMKGGAIFEKFKKLPKAVIASIYLLFILNLIFYTSIYSSVFMTILERFIGSIFFVFFLFEQAFCENRLFTLGNMPKLSYLGKISYGLFCYHGLVILLFTRLIDHFGWLNNTYSVFLINPLITFALTVLISAISYEYFEKPIMRLRYKIKPA